MLGSWKRGLDGELDYPETILFLFIENTEVGDALLAMIRLYISLTSTDEQALSDILHFCEFHFRAFICGGLYA